MSKAYKIVQRARYKAKLDPIELISKLTDDFIELHGDAVGGDDPSVIAGMGMIGSQAVTLISTNRVAETRIGSCPMPSGYRKMQRLVGASVKFGRPILTIVDTPGAYPGDMAEYEGQAEAIASLLRAVLAAPVPILSIITGEGGSGGALALSCGDQVWIGEESYFSVISPEGYASIVWKDKTRNSDAAESLNLTPTSLVDHNIIDEIKDEQLFLKDTNILKSDIFTEIHKLMEQSKDELLEKRYRKYRKL